jgi:hypothetical protein
MPTTPEYYQRNKERIKQSRLERIKAWTPEQWEESRRRCREHYAKNKARILGYKKKHRDANKDEHNAKIRAKRAAGPRAHDYLKRNYGLTIEQYQAKLDAQGGVCAVCAKPDPVPRRRLAVDHCHDTGRVRGLLCGLCNSAIGKFKDDPKMLDKAAAYLRAHGKD